MPTAGAIERSENRKSPSVAGAASDFADLKAMVDGAGRVAITGKLDPLGAQPSVDLKIDFKNVDLLPLSPYSGKYAGFELARGKLVLDVNLLVDGKKIDSANVITLNQFTFGSPVKSADATSLPVRLGVARLKDTDGKIVIDVPVQRNTDDPNFRIGRVVLRVIVNLLTKAAASPVALLGSAFGGGGDELAFQEFAPGSPELQAAEIKKLQTMVTALTNRPALSLDLEGCYDAADDAYALKRVKLEERCDARFGKRSARPIPTSHRPSNSSSPPRIGWRRSSSSSMRRFCLPPSSARPCHRRRRWSRRRHRRRLPVSSGVCRMWLRSRPGRPARPPPSWKTPGSQPSMPSQCRQPSPSVCRSKR